MVARDARTGEIPADDPLAAACDGEPRWLSGPEQEAWKAAALLMLQLPGPLDNQLRRDSGITLFEYLVLSFLSMAPGDRMRMSELARLANGSLSRLSNVVKRLEDRGWVSRAADPEDGRYTVARLTPSGRRLVTAAAPGHARAVRQLLIDPLTTAQLRILADIGHRLQATLGC
jgi:DNA-binding MarR family transcriptional regulator